MAKKYKPGQFVSIGGKLCRVKRRCIFPCSLCVMRTNCTNELTIECSYKLGDSNYPEPVKS